MMNKIIGNERQIMNAMNMAKERKNGIILCGPKGVGKRTIATELARKILCLEDGQEGCACKSCMQKTHPDILVVQKQDDKREMGVEEANLILDKCSYMPSISSQNVILIDGICEMNEIAQNKLLKTTEEGQNNSLFICVAHSGEKILNTLRSRFQCIDFYGLTYEEFIKTDVVSDFSEKHKKLYFGLTGGAPGMVPRYQDIEPILDEILESVPKGIELMQPLGMIKEKNKESYYEQYKDRLQDMFRFLQKLFYEGYLESIAIPFKRYILVESFAEKTPEFFIEKINLCNIQLERCVKPSYSVDEFTQSLISLQA